MHIFSLIPKTSGDAYSTLIVYVLHIYIEYTNKHIYCVCKVKKSLTSGGASESSSRGMYLLLIKNARAIFCIIAANSNVSLSSLYFLSLIITASCFYIDNMYIIHHYIYII
jgi:hypothetical protein